MSHAGASCDGPDLLLYEAEIDQGHPFRCFNLGCLCFLWPPFWIYLATHGIKKFARELSCDEMFFWIRKEYMTRTFFRVYPNRIEVNEPSCRLFGWMGCGSWSADDILVHPFDRGAFGFRAVRCGVRSYLCCNLPVYGGTVARQRCQCNGSLWPRLLDCGGWWCDEWLCDIWFCTYRYTGIADPEETSVAASIALQAYFEGRRIGREDMERCIEFWRNNISEMHNLGNPSLKRDVMCEPLCIPCFICIPCHECVHPRREIPYNPGDDECTSEVVEVYKKYEDLRNRQVQDYRSFWGPVRNGTICRQLGCRRVFGRRGLIFCTEGCCDGPNPYHPRCTQKKRGEPAPAIVPRDIDDEHDASIILQKVLGDPPNNVLYRRFQWDEENQLRLIERPQRNLPPPLDDSS